MQKKFGGKEKITTFAIPNEREHSSVGSERLPYKQRVGGSTPSAPTQKRLGFSSGSFLHIGPDEKIQKKFGSKEKITTFAIRFRRNPDGHSSWRDGRVVDYGSLENC